MTPPMTPEHFQLLSDKKLEAVANPTDRANASEADRAMVRMARYEMCRRRCEVPVHDRYVFVSV